MRKQINDLLFRPYYKDNKPVTKKYYLSEKEANEWGECFAGKDNFIIKQKDINSLVSKRKKSGTRGLY